jgi:uncharacterized surface protein with fasciclin (FAS1) repeats
MATITEVMMHDKNLTTMLRSVKAAGMETILNATGPFTVFAPSEMAFGKLAQGTLASLLKPENKVQLNQLLAHHIVNGTTHFKDFTDGQQLTTLHGTTLTVKVTAAGTTINGATVQRRDADATNGVLHSLDKVIATN